MPGGTDHLELVMCLLEARTVAWPFHPRDRACDISDILILAQLGADFWACALSTPGSHAGEALSCSLAVPAVCTRTVQAVSYHLLQRAILEWCVMP
jgi:hypothetical protein